MERSRRIHAGFRNYLDVEDVIGISPATSAPIKRLIKDRRANGVAVDMTRGHRTKTAIFMSNASVVLVGVHPDTIVKRILATVTPRTS